MLYRYSGSNVSGIAIDPPTVEICLSSHLVTATVVVIYVAGVDLNRLLISYWYSEADIQGAKVNRTWVCYPPPIFSFNLKIEKLSITVAVLAEPRQSKNVVAL